jgi:hypothetical protein
MRRNSGIEIEPHLAHDANHGGQMEKLTRITPELSFSSAKASSEPSSSMSSVT